MSFGSNAKIKVDTDESIDPTNFSGPTLEYDNNTKPSGLFRYMKLGNFETEYSLLNGPPLHNNSGVEIYPCLKKKLRLVLQMNNLKSHLHN
mmetsp:Transcript_63033/g.74558  ORF Transcript_63033/g.74558 Transcript_63033/m.74558 type:complete len:91 (+) Transcript_63033:417-689(+)